VVKYYSGNYQGGSPEYDFQFGGTSPIRSSFPVPVNIIVSDQDAGDVAVDTTNFNNNLSGSDTTVQAALETIDDLTLYTDSAVDSHLNTSTATTNQLLSWTGSDYDWVDPSAGGGLSNVVEDTTPQLGGDLDTNSNKIYDASGKVTIEASGSNPVLWTNTTSFAGDLNFYVFGYGPANWLGAYQYNTAGGYRLQRAIASGSTDDGSHNHDHRLYGADVTLKARVQADNANAPLTLDASSVTFANGSDIYTFPTADGTTGQVLTTNGSGTLTFQDASGGDVVNDTTPQLGGNLDVQDNYIYTSHVSGDVQIKATTSTEPVIFMDNGNNSAEIRLIQNTSDALGTVISAYDDIQSNYGDLNFQARTIIFDGATYPVTFRTTANGLMFNFQDENDSNASLFNIGDIKIQASRPIQFPLYTSTEIAGLTGTAAGMVVFNSSTNKLQCYDGTAWQNLH
jgi:hypothetical protein